MKRPEILAPVGSPEALLAAVRCGADAVYLGQKQFSARKDSANFDADALKEAVKTAHRSGVKVHQALNIVVFDRELEGVKECIRAACEAGVDAFIIEDLGVMEMAASLAPEIPRHASTQMAIHSAEGAKAARKLGFSRVVLARELSREEIAAIRAAVPELELEVFVHGAHCMSMSGQCYMSAVFGSKSGSRGQCAQPCRLPFAAAGADGARRGENVLSLKDMSLLQYLPALAAMGIDSFKIEGRLKRPEYTAAAVTACKKALAGEKYDLDTLRSVFSRSGFTDAYYTGSIGREMFGVRRKEDVSASAGVLKGLAALYHKETPRVPVGMAFSTAEGEESRLTLTDFEGHTVQTSGEPPQKAVSAPADGETARRFLGKLGGTPYLLTEFSALIGEGLTLPASAFNAMRREAVEKLDRERTRVNTPFTGELPPLPEVSAPAGKYPVFWGSFSSFGQLPLEETGFFDRILLPLPEIEKNPEALFPVMDRVAAILPRFTFSGEDALVRRLSALKEKGLTALSCQNPAHVMIGLSAGLELLGGEHLNLTNSRALWEGRKLGLSAAVLSPEIAGRDARELWRGLPMGMVAYGRLPLMSVRSCPVRAFAGCKACGRKGSLTDRKGVSFPVRCDFDRSVSFVYNSCPTVLTDRLSELAFLDFAILSFTTESPREVREVLAACRRGSRPEGEFTRGLFYRGVE